MNRSVSSVMAVILAVSMSPCLQGQMILVDDFEGNLDAWTTIDFSAGQPWGPGVFEIVNGEFRMAHTGSVPVPPGTPATEDVLIAAWNPSVDPFYSNGYLRAQVRIDEVANVTAIHMRADLSTFTTYLLYTNTGTVLDPKKFRLSKLEDGAETILWQSDFMYTQGEEWIMELGAVGNTLSAKAWQVGTAEPPAPQFETTDSEPLPPGQFLLTNDVPTPDVVASFADASFDNVYFTVPEPAAVALVLVGLLGAAAYRRRCTCLAC